MLLICAFVARFKTGDTHELQMLVKDRLWQIAVSRHGVTRPADHCPAVRQSFQTSGQSTRSTIAEHKVAGFRNGALSTPVTTELPHQMQSSLKDGSSANGMTAYISRPNAPVTAVKNARLGHCSIGIVELNNCSRRPTVGLARQGRASGSLLSDSKPKVDVTGEKLSENSDSVYLRRKEILERAFNVDTNSVDDQQSSNVDSDFAYLSEMHLNLNF